VASGEYVRDAARRVRVGIACKTVEEEAVITGNVFIRERGQKRGYNLLFGERSIQSRHSERRISR
jgi:ribosomal protein L27